MGMSASQARYLQLTARRSNLEFEAQQICHKRLTLAQQTEYISKEYNAKISDRHLYFNFASASNIVGNESKQKRLDYYDITNGIDNKDQPGLGMRIVDADGREVVPALPQPEKDEEGNIINPINPDDYVVDVTIGFNQNANNSLYSNACDYLEDKLRNGEWFLQKIDREAMEEDSDELAWSNVNYQTLTTIDDLLYKENDSAAQAEYTRDSEAIQKQDKMLEMKLKQVTTEQESVKAEQESLKKIVDENIEKSFKTFA